MLVLSCPPASEFEHNLREHARLFAACLGKQLTLLSHHFGQLIKVVFGPCDLQRSTVNNPVEDPRECYQLGTSGIHLLLKPGLHVLKLTGNSVLELPQAIL